MCAIQYFVSKFTIVSGVDIFPVGTSCGQAPDPTAACVEAQLIIAVLHTFHPKLPFPRNFVIEYREKLLFKQLHLVVIMFET